MNESAPATLRVPASWVERLAAGLLAVAWVWWNFVFGGGMTQWSIRVRDIFTEALNAWQWLITTGEWAQLMQPESEHFAYVVSTAADIYCEVVSHGLILLACWLAGGSGSRRLRIIFWLAVLSHGFAYLGRLTAGGRFMHLLFDRSFPSAARLPPWHGGWLDGFRLPENADGIVNWTVIAFEIILGTLMLWIAWRRRRQEKAEDALAAGSAEGAGSRA